MGTIELQEKSGPKCLCGGPTAREDEHLVKPVPGLDEGHRLVQAQGGTPGTRTAQDQHQCGVVVNSVLLLRSEFNVHGTHETRRVRHFFAALWYVRQSRR